MSDNQEKFEKLLEKEKSLDKHIAALKTKHSVIFWRLRYVGQIALWLFVFAAIAYNLPSILFFLPLVTYYAFLGRISSSREVVEWELAILSRKELLIDLNYATASVLHDLFSSGWKKEA